MYDQGLLGPKNEREATRCYEELASAGDADGCYYAASLRLRGGDAVGALGYFLRAADAGNPSAAYWAAAIYGGEKGHAIDPCKEKLYLVKAAELGHMFAKRELARKRIRDEKGLIAKAHATLEWMRIKKDGFKMIALDVNDLRVR